MKKIKSTKPSSPMPTKGRDEREQREYEKLLDRFLDPEEYTLWSRETGKPKEDGVLWKRKPMFSNEYYFEGYYGNVPIMVFRNREKSKNQPDQPDYVITDVHKKQEVPNQ